MVDLRLVFKLNVNSSYAIMKKLFILVFTLLEITTLLAQKKEIDLDAIRNWEQLRGYDISNNGQYVWYEVVSSAREPKLYVRNISGSFKQEFDSTEGPMFTYDSKFIFYSTPQGLHKLNLLTGEQIVIKGASAGKQPHGGKGRWLVYTIGEALWLYDMKKSSKKNFGQVAFNVFNNEGTVLVLLKESQLIWVDLLSGQERSIFKGSGLKNISFDASGSRLIFTATVGERLHIYKYDKSWNTAQLVLSENKPMADFKIADLGLKFSDDGKHIYFKVKAAELELKKEPDVRTEHLDIWHYKDTFLQPQQSFNIKHNPNPSYLAVVSFDSGLPIIIENNERKAATEPGDKWVILKTITNENEVYWNDEQWPQYHYISIHNGQTRSFLPSNKNVQSVQLSTGEQFITWYDTLEREYYSYNIATRSMIKMTKGFIPQEERDSKFPGSIMIDGWLKDDKAVVAHDKYDIWLLDPLGVKIPVCLTSGYGRRAGVLFRPVLFRDELNNKRIGPDLLLACMEETTKRNGFCKIRISEAKLLEMPVFQEALLYYPSVFVDRPPKMPVKAKRGDGFLLTCQSDRQAPNVVFTKNFKQFIPLSAIVPQKQYKWHQARLIHWKTEQNEPLSGILYTPDDLDTTKKYPVIFNYYEELSKERYKYRSPGLNVVNINIPWYLSRGYIVFVPDILRATGHTGESALRSVLSGAYHLIKTYSWVDKARMGLQGHSFGGYITNFVVTHSTFFAAAQSSAGPTDFVSGYGGIGFTDKSVQFLYEVGQNNLGTTPWDDPMTYITNSPIFSVKLVTTPLLIMHGIRDGAVNFSQAVELFTALRRVKKRVWLLQYDEGHVLGDFDGKGFDFHKRQQQYFDHFLKGEPAPQWMTKGVPAKFKGIKSGLELDTSSLAP